MAIFKNKLFLAVLFVGFLLFPANVFGQRSSYKVIETTPLKSSVKIHLIVYCKDKKEIDKEAQLSALNIVMFDGCENTMFSKALLDDGQETSYQQNPDYFDNLYNNRYGDFISSVTLLSKYKKADKQNGTEFEITVNASKLRKDLEKNNIKRKFGL